MKAASIFTSLLLSALCSLSTAAAVTRRAEEYTSIILFRDKDYSGPFLTDRYKKSKDLGCIILSDKK
jgi:5S rRNA maturation endonuclease (ribonuclease M5)